MIKKELTLILAFVTSLSFMARGAVFVEDWNAGTDEGWAVKDMSGGVYSTITSPGASMGSRTEYLQISDLGAQGGILEDLIYADSSASGGNLSGNLLSESKLQLDFYANAWNTGAGNSLYFYVLNTPSSALWLYDVSSLVVAGQWTTINAPYALNSWFDNNSGNPASSMSSTFLTDFGGADEVGIMLGFQGTGTEVFGLDNYSLVPEPADYIVLGVALLSLAFTFRRKLENSLVYVKTRIS